MDLPEVGFSPEEVWQIAHAVGASSSADRERVRELLDAISHNSQAQVEMVRRLNTQIIEMYDQRIEAAGGLVRADVLEWSENRASTISCMLASFRTELARAIGFPVSYAFPWEG